MDLATKDRRYSASAYFSPAQYRPILHLLTGSEVTQISLDNRNGLAITNGVVVTNKRTRQVFTPDREVILAPGTMNSTKNLRIVWDRERDILQSYSIDVVIENTNVGESLQDHPMTGVIFETRGGVETLDDLFRQDPKAVEAAMKA